MCKFSFQRFTVHQERCAMKVGTDGTLLGAWAGGGRRVLDIGTGTGLIALMMAQRFEDAVVDAIDIDRDSCEQAHENVAASPFSDRIHVLHSRVQDYTSVSGYDAIVSNPPFFMQSLKAPDERRTTARHTDELSYRDLMHHAARLLNPDGEFSVVIPFDCRAGLETEAVMAGLFPSRVCAVRTTSRKPPRRYLLAFRKKAVTVSTTELLMGSDEYRELVKDFYLKI